MNLVEAGLELNRVKTHEQENPAKLFKILLSGIKTKYNKEEEIIKEMDLIATVLYIALKDYQSILTVTQQCRGSVITIGDMMEESMTHFWRQTKGLQTMKISKDDDETKVALVANNSNSKGKNRSGKTKLETHKCWNCGEPGHITTMCWHNLKNASTIPKGWKPKNLSGKEDKEDNSKKGKSWLTLGDDDLKVKFLLTSMTFPKTQKLLYYLNVWIGNTGATVHSYYDTTSSRHDLFETTKCRRQC